MTVSYRLSEIAAQLGGRVLGHAEACISQVATLETAQSAQISFFARRESALVIDRPSSRIISPAATADSRAAPRRCREHRSR